MKKYNRVAGNNKHVCSAHRDAWFWFKQWQSYGKPKSGYLYKQMNVSKKCFKQQLKYCRNNDKQIRMDIIIKNHSGINSSTILEEH